MINDEFERMERIIGSSSLETLKNKRVAVFGVGGVGSFACEALARASIGFITLIDNDDVAFSNIIINNCSFYNCNSSSLFYLNILERKYNLWIRNGTL